jgi:hypothetical protein
MMKINVKVGHENEFRRFLFQETSYQSLLDTVVNLFSLEEGSIALKYVDDDEEWITFSSDIELETGICLSKDILRLRIIAINASNSIECRSVEITSSIPFETLPPWVRRRLVNKVAKFTDPDNTEAIYAEEIPIWMLKKLNHKFGLNFEKIEMPVTPIDKPCWRNKRGKKGRGRRGKRGRCGRGRRWNNASDDSLTGSTESSSTDISEESPISPEEQEFTVQSLKKERALYKEKINVLNGTIKEMQISIRESRRNAATTEEICNLREKVTPLKQERKLVRQMIRSTNQKIRSLNNRKKE